MSASLGALFELAKDGASTKPLTLRIGESGRHGASGAVYELANEYGKAVKIYHEEERSKFEEKVRTMVRVKYNRPHTDHFDLAWPEAVVVDRSREFLGFKMPFFGSGWVDLESLMQAAEAEKTHDFGERERLQVGINLAMAVKELHLLNVHCIDLKPQNIRVNLSNNSVSVIDCDGMSVIDISEQNGRRFFADKSTPEFWAPENIGVKIKDFKDPEAHDRFALATINFMLFNRGIHPYQGVMTFETPGTETTAGKIKNNLYPYGAGKGKIKPHGDSLYAFWPEATKGLFDRAFSTIDARPSADEWLTYLSRLASSAEVCNNNPKLHLKYPEIGCPVCTRDASVPRPAPPKLGASVPSLVGASHPGVGSGKGSSVGGPGTPILPPLPAHTLQPAYTPLATAPSQSGAGAAIVTVLVLVGLVAVAALIASLPSTSPSSSTSNVVVSHPPPPPPPPQNPCLQQWRYNQAVQGGIDGLKSFVLECRYVGGYFYNQAASSLAIRVYNDALGCMGRSCNFDQCLSIYTQYFNGGNLLDDLQRRRQEVANRCRPSAPPPPQRRPCGPYQTWASSGCYPPYSGSAQPNCFVFNGERYCQ